VIWPKWLTDTLIELARTLDAPVHDLVYWTRETWKERRHLNWSIAPWRVLGFVLGLLLGIPAARYLVNEPGIWMMTLSALCLAHVVEVVRYRSKLHKAISGASGRRRSNSSMMHTMALLGGLGYAVMGCLAFGLVILAGKATGYPFAPLLLVIVYQLFPKLLYRIGIDRAAHRDVYGTD
jgi:uncharacterized membrane protein YfcA